jgi:polyhydroxyalkanoate synthase
MMPEMPAVSAEVMARLDEDTRRNFLRMKHWSEMVMSPKEPEVGPTPREEIYRKNKSRLWRYASKRTYRTPLLFVPNLGISRLTFRPDAQASFIEHMTSRAFDFYLVDWGCSTEDNSPHGGGRGDEDPARLAWKAPESSGASEMSVLGYLRARCLWRVSHHAHPSSSNYTTWRPHRFSQVGMFGQWLDARYFDVDKYVDTLGSIPADMVKLGFKLLKPTMDLSTNVNLWWNLWNPEYVAGFTALNKWANEYLPFPGEFFRQWVKDFYQQNKLVKGELAGWAGGQLRLSAIACPAAAVGRRKTISRRPPA